MVLSESKKREFEEKEVQRKKRREERLKWRKRCDLREIGTS